MADIIREAARGLSRLDKFYLMSGVSWAITEIERGRKCTPDSELSQHKPFMTGRDLIHHHAGEYA